MILLLNCIYVFLLEQQSEQLLLGIVCEHVGGSAVSSILIRHYREELGLSTTFQTVCGRRLLGFFLE